MTSAFSEFDISNRCYQVDVIKSGVVEGGGEVRKVAYWKIYFWLEVSCPSYGQVCNTWFALTLRLLMSYIYIYIYGAHILDVSRSHTTTQHSR